MDSIDDKLKEYLEKERQRLGRGQRDLCPPTEDFYQFIMDELKGERLEKMLGHLRNCAEDQELVIKTRRLLGWPLRKRERSFVRATSQLRRNEWHDSIHQA